MTLKAPCKATLTPHFQVLIQNAIYWLHFGHLDSALEHLNASYKLKKMLKFCSEIHNFKAIKEAKKFTQIVQDTQH